MHAVTARRLVQVAPSRVAALAASGGSAPALYSLLAIALAVSVLMQAATFAIAGDPDALPTAIGMAGSSAILVAARWLALRSRDAAGAVLTACGLVAMTAAIAVLYEYATVSMLVPIIAYLVVVPHLRGWRLAAGGVPAFLVACLAAASPLLPHPLPANSVWDLISAIMGGFVGLAVLFIVGHRQIRDREAAASRFEAMVRDLPLAVARVREDGHLLDANDAFHRLVAEASPNRVTEVPRLSRAALETERATGTWAFETPGFAVPVRGLARWVDATPAGQRVLEITLEDLQPQLEARRARERLADIVQCAGDAILAIDRDDRVVSWNAAAERIFGWSAQEITGQPIGWIIPPERLDEHNCWRVRVAAGETISNLETERMRRDGTRRTMTLTLAPIHAPDGSVVGVSAIERDVTEERRLEARLQAEARQHREVREALGRLKARSSAERTADAICEVISGTEAFAHAAVLAFAPDEAVEALAVWSDRRPRPDLRPHLDAVRDQGHLLMVRARSGPWLEDLAAGEGLPHRAMLLAMGVRGLAAVPLAVDGEILGLLVAASLAGDPTPLREHLPTFIDLGAAAGAVIGSQLAGRRADQLERWRLGQTIRHSQFWPVFQPIVELGSGAIVGHEALTRFANDASPDGVFAAAARLGIGLEFEAATLGAALGEAMLLPEQGDLHLNVSPDLVLAGTALSAVLRSSGRPVVLEITEHREIADYGALRAALERLPQPVRVAVDDAGAGFASLHHILELRPTSVKLDRSLVADVDADRARQALVAGLTHFATRTGCTLIAEGVETQAERQTLLDLGVTRGQGYLFGRPAPARGSTRQARAATVAASMRPAGSRRPTTARVAHG